MAEKEEDRRTAFRIDFVSDIEIDEEKGIVRMVAVPDPRRYEWIMKDGKRFLLDKFDRLLFSEEVYRALGEKAVGLPIYYEPQKLGDSRDYIATRATEIERLLDGKETFPTYEDPSEEFLRQLPANKLQFAILSIDMVGSTRRATSSDPDEYATLVKTLTFELTEIVPKFSGFVLKHTGDGLIAFFPEPTLMGKSDLALDCALTMRRLVHEGLNPALGKKGQPPIDVRIGLEAGQAIVVTMGSPSSKQNKDLIGAVINIATKVQALAAPGQICLGDAIVRQLHTNWRLLCSPLTIPQDWPFKDKEGGAYQVHRYRIEDHLGETGKSHAART